MSENYDHKKVEKKWQKYWEDNKTFKADDNSKKEKFYALDMFPYPSGAGLHVGHPEGYTATDIISRKKRMEGFEVLHPMGWDAFGLPAENYAIKTGVHPKESTLKNIDTFTGQIKSLGFSYDWDREISSCMPDYYKWTQWCFLFLYKNNLAYKKKAPVNWCNDCMTVLANEQVVDGCCERCRNQVIQKELEQWFFKVTDVIEDVESNGRTTSGLINGLDKIDWPNSTKISQKNWIGKSTGIDIEYKIEGSNKTITTFTTRPDTNFGATFIVLAPDCKFVKENLDIFPEQEKVINYINKSLEKTELDRLSEGRKKTGVFTGLNAINNLNGKKMPIYIGDFVLGHVGTGCVVGVPGHDIRDFEFAQEMSIEVIRVVVASDGDKSDIAKPEQVQESEGIMINSEFLDGMEIMEAKEKIMDYLEEKGWGKRVVNYKLRDWLISRQRYWGAPIPIVYDPEGNAHPIPEKHLPWDLPTDVDYKPKGTSPLGSSKELVERTEKIFGKGWTPEIDTMDTFVCSSWYYFRFADANNSDEFASKEMLKKWLPVDLYVGGAEHTVLHLLYSRFFTKAFHMHGLIDFDEPFSKLRHQGMILAEDGQKMSKSLGNVVNPDEIVEQYGADTLRVYEMFMGPFEQSKAWNTNAVEGIYKFLQKIWRIYNEKKLVDCEGNCSDKFGNLPHLFHKTVKKVSEDIDNFKFNTVISQLMIFMNEAQKFDELPKFAMESICKIISPLAPHLAEEIWSEILGNKGTISYEDWPKWNEEMTKENEINLAIQVNGKLRSTILVSADIQKEEALNLAKADEKIHKWLENKDIVKEIFVPGKIVNLVVR